MDDLVIGIGRKLDLPYEQAVEKTREALKAEGFGILTEIDVQKTLKEKIDAQYRRYVILGACNPPLAHRALNAEIDIGLFLPCNVIVYEEGEGSVASAINPDIMVSFFNSDEVRAVAAEAGARLRRAIDSI